MQSLFVPVGLDAVLTTHDLDCRTARATDHAAESRALADLARTLADRPHDLLQRLAELAMELCGAESAGISILECENGFPVFRWHAAAGEFSHIRWGTIDRDTSPCGMVVSRDSTLLFAYPERHFPYPMAVDPPIAETVLVPFHAAGKPVGTVWAVAHTPDRRFDPEDVRLLTSLSRFAAAAWQTVAALDAAEAGKAELEQRVEERTREARAKEEKYRALFDSIDEAFCVIDLVFDGERPVDYRFVEVNAGFETQTGVRNPSGRRAREIAPGHEVHWLETYGRVARTGLPERFESRAGELDRWFDVYTFKVDHDHDDRVGVLFRDVTERHVLEKQLRHSQKMEAFGQLAGGVAHDFNNMLQVINGYADLALIQLPEAHPLADLLVEIRKAGERSAALTRQLLAFARQQVAAPKVLNPSAAAADTAGMLRRLIGEDVRLVTDFPPGVWPVFADPGHLEQVLLNLAVNARDAMPTGGTLKVATRNVLVTVEAADGMAGEHAVLSVSDTGTGMSPEVQARIFEPFFTTKGVGQGTGLGLAMVYGIVQQAGGHIRVASEVGRGTTFDVYLPRSRQPEDEEIGMSGVRNVPRGKETVLVVEDEDAVRGLVRIVLTACGYTVLEAGDGEAAERLATRHRGPIHLVLSDVVMPGAGGRWASERVIAKHAEARVVFMSGYADDAVVRNGVMSSDVPFLQKPFTPAVLAAKVRQVLDAPR